MNQTDFFSSVIIESEEAIKDEHLSLSLKEQVKRVNDDLQTLFVHLDIKCCPDKRRKEQ